MRGKDLRHRGSCGVRFSPSVLGVARRETGVACPPKCDVAALESPWSDISRGKELRLAAQSAMDAVDGRLATNYARRLDRRKPLCRRCFEFREGRWTSVAIVGERLYLGGHDGKIYALGVR